MDNVRVQGERDMVDQRPICLILIDKGEEGRADVSHCRVLHPATCDQIVDGGFSRVIGKF
jgi:hypothetical protein